jgi:hypothetical protein
MAIPTPKRADMNLSTTLSFKPYRFKERGGSSPFLPGTTSPSPHLQQLSIFYLLIFPSTFFIKAVRNVPESVLWKKIADL